MSTTKFISSLSVLLLSINLMDSVQAQVIEPNVCLDFNAVLQLSAQRDPSVALAKAQESEAEAEIKEVSSLFKPQISAFGRTGFGDTGIVDSSVSNQLGIRASQRLYDFGDAKYARRAAEENFSASKDDTRNAGLIAARDTGFAYLELNEANEQLELTSRRREFFTQQLIATDNLLSKGGATRTERAAIASQLANAESFLLELEFRKERAETQIQIDTGTNFIACSDEYSDYLENNLAVIFDANSAVSLAIDNNPNIQALEKRAKSLSAASQRQKRSRLPIINLVATGSYSSFDNFNNFDFRDRVGIDVSLPLYSGQAISARNQRASAREAAANARVQEAKRQLNEQVSITFRRINSLRSQLKKYQEVEKQTLLQFSAAEIEQKAGTKTIRDIVEIRLEYEQAGLQTIRTKYDLERQRLTLASVTAQLLK